MIKFGTGGWRARIGEDFTRDNICKVARGIAMLAKEQNRADKPIIIGYDRRFLSMSAAQWVAEVLAASGIKSLFLHRSSPTPFIMYAVKTKELDYGVEITASHNPPEYNGIKLIVEEGRDASVECTERLEQLIEAAGDIKRVNFERAVSIGMIEYLENPFNDYIDSILDKLDVPKIRERGLRILFDPMHGSGMYSLLTILCTVRCTVDVINSNKDAYFGGRMPAPDRRQLRELSEMVVEDKYDLGIALDGDGDRLGIVDGDGNYIDANQILVMLYYYLHEYRGWNGPVVRNMSTTHMLDAVAAAFGEECFEVPVGFKWVSKKLDETDAVLGGESSGGLTVRGHIFGKDSTYAACLFVEMICATGKTPMQLWNELETRFGTYRSANCSLSFPPADRAAIESRIYDPAGLPDFGKKLVRVSNDDGLKLYFDDDAFITCRFSGTEPLLRIFSEADSTRAAESLVTKMRDFILPTRK